MLFFIMLLFITHSLHVGVFIYLSCINILLCIISFVLMYFSPRQLVSNIPYIVFYFYIVTFILTPCWRWVNVCIENIIEQLQLSKRGKIYNRVLSIYSFFLSILIAIAFCLSLLHFVYIIYIFLNVCLLIFNKIFHSKKRKKKRCVAMMMCFLLMIPEWSISSHSEIDFRIRDFLIAMITPKITCTRFTFATARAEESHITARKLIVIVLRELQGYFSTQCLNPQ